jgi:hypothetical protein
MTTDADNASRWDGVARPHYEVWYLTFNHRASSTGYWICYTLDAPVAGEPFAQLWFARFDAADPGRNFAIRRTLPIAALRAEARPFSLRIGDAELRHDAARGAVGGAGHDARWELRWTPGARTHRTLPPILYAVPNLAETLVLGPSLDAALAGTVVVDGRALELGGEPGQQSHLWGTGHAREWAWGHCNAFDGRSGACLEVLTARLERRGLVTPPMTVLTLYLDGRRHRWNRFPHTVVTGADVATTRYAFRAWRPDVRVEGEFTCRPADMVATEYFDPRGVAPSWCHNTEVADLRVTLWTRDGLVGPWRVADELRAPRTGHFEVGRLQRDPAIEREHRGVG